MSPAPAPSADLLDMIGFALRRMTVTLRKTVRLQLLLWLLSMVFVYAGRLTVSPMIQLAIELVVLAGIVFTVCALIIRTEGVLTGVKRSLQDDLTSTLMQSGHCIGAIVIEIALIVGYFLLSNHVLHRLGLLSPVATQADVAQHVLIYALGVITPIVVLIVLFIFVLPIILVDRKPCWIAMRLSAQFVGFQWLRVFTLYVLIGFLLLLTMPSTLHAHFFMHYHVYPLYVLLVYLAMVPFILNLWLLVWFQLRHTK